MGLKLTGTTANNVLHALKIGVYGSGAGLVNTTNFGIINNNVLNDLVNGNPVWPGTLMGASAGTTPGAGGAVLNIPNRGTLTCLQGDIIAYDSTGWPILISKNAFANGPWNNF